jgi:hypothetical protein
MSDLQDDARALLDRPEFQAVLDQWSANPQAAVAQLRPLADSGDPAADVLVAWLSPQVGVPWPEGLPYARRAADAGIAPALNNYVGNLVGDPSLHADFLRFVGVLLDAGWPIDPIGWVPQLLQQGNQETARQLIELSFQRPPAGARKQWDELVASVTPAAETIRHQVEDVTTTATDSLDLIRAEVERVEQERSRAENLVQEVADLANEGASQHLAKEYAVQAKKEETTANTYQKWAIGVGAAAALATGVIAYFAFTKEHGTGAILTKAALALPILAFFAYIARLAALHRKQSWRWRHIELQIRTANPFVSPLEDDQRRLLIAALALRFFPGQRFDVEGGTGGETVDPVAFLAQLLPGLPPPSPAASMSATTEGSEPPA